VETISSEEVNAALSACGETIGKSRALPLRDGAHASGATGPLLLLVTWTLTNVDGGTRLRLVHSGAVLPKNGTAVRIEPGLEEGRRHDSRRVERAEPKRPSPEFLLETGKGTRAQSTRGTRAAPTKGDVTDQDPNP
jgi:hypothetical protein